VTAILNIPDLNSIISKPNEIDLNKFEVELKGTIMKLDWAKMSEFALGIATSFETHIVADQTQCIHVLFRVSEAAADAAAASAAKVPPPGRNMTRQQVLIAPWIGHILKKLFHIASTMEETSESTPVEKLDHLIKKHAGDYAVLRTAWDLFESMLPMLFTKYPGANLVKYVDKYQCSTINAGIVAYVQCLHVLVFSARVIWPDVVLSFE